MKPTLSAGGSLWPIHASAHLSALASMHIGSAPGVLGLSGMQVQPFLPLRRTFIVPSGWAATIVASLAIAAGAATMALSIGSLGWVAVVLVWALLASTRLMSAWLATSDFWQAPSGSAAAASSIMQCDLVMFPSTLGSVG